MGDQLTLPFNEDFVIGYDAYGIQHHPKEKFLKGERHAKDMYPTEVTSRIHPESISHRNYLNTKIQDEEISTC